MIDGGVGDLLRLDQRGTEMPDEIEQRIGHHAVDQGCQSQQGADAAVE